MTDGLISCDDPMDLSQLPTDLWTSRLPESLLDRAAPMLRSAMVNRFGSHSSESRTCFGRRTLRTPTASGLTRERQLSGRWGTSHRICSGRRPMTMRARFWDGVNWL